MLRYHITGMRRGSHAPPPLPVPRHRPVGGGGGPPFPLVICSGKKLDRRHAEYQIHQSVNDYTEGGGRDGDRYAPDAC